MSYQFSFSIIGIDALLIDRALILNLQLEASIRRLSFRLQTQRYRTSTLPSWQLNTPLAVAVVYDNSTSQVTLYFNGVTDSMHVLISGDVVLEFPQQQPILAGLVVYH